MLSSALLVSNSGADSPPPDAATAVSDDFGRVVKMSPFEVTASRIDFLHWIKLRSPHFVLYTDTGEAEATTIVRQMEMLHQAIQSLFHRKALNLAPIMVLLPTGQSDWRKIAIEGTGKWKGDAKGGGTSRRLISVMYNWQSEGLRELWGSLGGSVTGEMNLSGPYWFRAGVGGLFDTATFGSDSLTIGCQGTARNWMDWAAFFRFTSKSPGYEVDLVEWKFCDQARSVLHFALIDREQDWITKLLAWAAFLEAGNPPTEENFKQYFGFGWRVWGNLIARSLFGSRNSPDQAGTYQSGTVHFPPAALQISVEVEQPSVREMRELFILAQIDNQRTKESEVSLDALLARGLKTNSLRELLADACGQWGRTDAELKELRALIAARSSNPAVYARAANILCSRRLGHLTSDSRLDGEDLAEVRTWSQKACELAPLYLIPNESLAWAEALSPTVEKQNVETIAGIYRHLEGNARTDNVAVALAIAQWRTGNVRQARALAEQVEKSVFSRETAKLRAHELLARLNAP